jgi:hypothetical protein
MHEAAQSNNYFWVLVDNISREISNFAQPIEKSMLQKKGLFWSAELNA